MKRTILTALAVICTAIMVFAQGDQPTITYSIVNQGDTAYFVKKNVLYSNGSYDETQTYIGADSAAITTFVNNLVAESANAHTEVAGLEGQLLNADTKASALSRDVSTICTSFVGKNLIKINASAYKGNFEGAWVIRDLVNNTTNNYTFGYNPTSETCFLSLDNNPATKISVWLLSPVRMEIRNFPTQGNHVRIAYRETRDNGRRVYTNAVPGASGRGITVIGVQTVPVISE